MSLELYAPNDYWMASDDEKSKICNGCGAKDGLKVPGTFYGLCIKEACNIHDWMYATGTTKADKLFADAMFRLNLTVIIDASETNLFNKILGPLRQSRASTYYFAVVEWGENAYWVDKTINDDLKITFNGRFGV